MPASDWICGRSCSPCASSTPIPRLAFGICKIELAAAAHQKHESRGDRHAAGAIPGDAKASLGGRMEMFGGGDSLFEGRRIFDLVFFEQV